MAGLYLHVPFCRQACHYCDFHFSTQTKHMADLVDAMVRESTPGSPRPALEGPTFTTLYLGGGTVISPTCSSFVWNSDGSGSRRQISANHPGGQPRHDQSPSNLVGAWRHTAQFGVQFHDETLAWMNRVHTGVQAERAIRLAHDLGVKA